VRQARKDAKPEKPGEALRHGRAYREIFQLVRSTLLEHAEGEQPREEAPYNDPDEV
jgi:ribosome-associated protein